MKLNVAKRLETAIGRILQAGQEIDEGTKERRNEGTKKRRNEETKQRRNKGTKERSNEETKQRRNECSLDPRLS